MVDSLFSILWTRNELETFSFVKIGFDPTSWRMLKEKRMSLKSMENFNISIIFLHCHFSVKVRKRKLRYSQHTKLKEKIWVKRTNKASTLHATELQKTSLSNDDNISTKVAEIYHFSAWKLEHTLIKISRMRNLSFLQSFGIQNKKLKNSTKLFKS